MLSGLYFQKGFKRSQFFNYCKVLQILITISNFKIKVKLDSEITLIQSLYSGLNILIYKMTINLGMITNWSDWNRCYEPLRLWMLEDQTVSFSVCLQTAYKPVYISSLEGVSLKGHNPWHTFIKVSKSATRNNSKT